MYKIFCFYFFVVLFLFSFSSLVFGLHARDIVGLSCNANDLPLFNFCDGGLLLNDYYGRLTKLKCEDGKWVQFQVQACGGVPEAQRYCTNSWCNPTPVSSDEECSSPVCVISFESLQGKGYGYVEAYYKDGTCQGTIFECPSNNYCDRKNCKSVSTPEIHEEGQAISTCCKPCTTTETHCKDNNDDDCDGLIDSNDPDCAEVPCGTFCCTDADCPNTCSNLTRFTGGKCSSSKTACLYSIVENCDDGNVCTVDSCTPDACVNSWIKNCCVTDADCSNCPIPTCTGEDCDKVVMGVIGACENNECVCTATMTIVECFSNADCNDYDPCNIDVCMNPGTAQARCSHNPGVEPGYVSCDGSCMLARCFTDSDCDDRVASTEDICVNPGTCEADCQHPYACPSPYVRCDGKCTYPTCSSRTNCDDGNPDTVDECINGGTCDAYCTHVSSSCPSGQIKCKGVCIVPVCFSSEDCDDSDVSSTDSCEFTGTCSAKCSHVFKDCGAGQIKCNGVCTTPVCSSDSDCEDGNKLTIDACNNPGTCSVSCSHKPCEPACSTEADCNDNNASTKDFCVNAGTCNAYCSHGPCTFSCSSIKECVGEAKCKNKWRCGTNCENTTCDVPCIYNHECDDDDPLTGDKCVNALTCNAYCVNKECPVACFSNYDCNDNNRQTSDYCEKAGTCEARCVYDIEPFPGPIGPTPSIAVEEEAGVVPNETIYEPSIPPVEPPILPANETIKANATATTKEGSVLALLPAILKLLMRLLIGK